MRSTRRTRKTTTGGGNQLPRYLVSVDEILEALDANGNTQSQQTDESQENTGDGNTQERSEPTNKDAGTPNDRCINSPSVEPNDVVVTNDKECDPEDPTVILSGNSESEDADVVHPNPKRSRITTKVGRSKEPIWEEFKSTRDNKGKIKSNKCKYCMKEVSPKPCRMREHLDKCRSKPKKPRAQTLLSIDSTTSTSDTASAQCQPMQDKTMEEFPSSSFIKSRMTVWKNESVMKARQEMDTIVGKMIYSANLPFQLVENPFFAKIAHKANIPGYKLPNRNKMGGEILDSVYDECSKENTARFQGRKVVILQDGWSTNQNQPVICHTLQSGRDSLMFDAVSTSVNKKNSPYCFQLLQQAIEKAEKIYKCTVVGVVTDNCNVMKNMRELARDNIQGLHVYGCVAHILNLCGQELTDSDLFEKIIQVQKYFRNHHFESASLTDLKGKRPMIPGKTRWNSQLDTLESYKSNHLLYLQIARDVNSNIRKEKSLLDILNDGNVYNDVDRQLDVLKPIAAALDKAQSDVCLLADAVDIWVNMLNKMPGEVKQRLKEKSNMILHGVSLAAYMIHPIYRGRLLTREQESVGFSEMNKLHFQLAITASSLKALDANIFPPHLLDERTMPLMTASAWWKNVGAYSSINSNVIDICESLMILPSSTAAIERAFSTLGNIITKKRNRLGLEKARKLAVVFKTLAFKLDKDGETSEENE